jgi:hypothetical protein
MASLYNPSLTVVVVLSALLGASTGACTVQADDAERFREALPAQDEVALRVPKSGAGSTRQGLHVATEPGTTAGTTARYYQLTRDLTNAVDVGTGFILAGIWTIVHTAPTSIEAKKAVWGPGSANALEPAIWRFTVLEVNKDEYDYVLEGQPKSGSGPWTAVLTGHGFGKAHPSHKQGTFTANNDAYKSLDPTRGHDEGTTKVTYDLRQLPATIAVELRPAQGRADVKVTHEAQGAGSVAIDAVGDLDPSKTTKLEDIHLVSRWTSNGSGRADALIKSGDLPMTVQATECWSASFARVYYEDTANFEPQSGSESTCALPAL